MNKLELAKKIESARDWDGLENEMSQLARLVDMEKEWLDADGEDFEEVVDQMIIKARSGSYIVVYGNINGDEYIKYFETALQADNFAYDYWYHLTDKERTQNFVMSGDYNTKDPEKVYNSRLIIGNVGK